MNELKQIVICAIRGYWNWRREEGPKVRRCVEFQVQSPWEEPEVESETESGAEVAGREEGLELGVGTGEGEPLGDWEGGIGIVGGRGGEGEGSRPLDERVEPRMVPGGKWVVLSNCGRMEIWKMGRCECSNTDLLKGGGVINCSCDSKPTRVWKDVAYRAGVEVLSFDFEARNVDDIVVAGVFLDTRGSRP